MNFMARIKKDWIIAAAIMAVAFAVFIPVLKGSFINWDDDVNVYENLNVSELSARSIGNMFSTTVVGGYTPLTTLSFSIENALYGMKPWVFHLNNLLLHLVCIALLFILLRKLGLSLFVTGITSLLFAIHPMHVESVAWVTERKDVLYGAFFLLSLIFYVDFYNSRRKLFYYLALGAFALSLLSKIQAVSLPLVLILIDYYYEKRFTLKQWANKIPFLLLSLATGIAGVIFLSRFGSLETGSVMPLVQRIFIGTFSLCIYLFKVIVPYPLSAIYPSPASLDIFFYISAGLVILLIVLVWRFARKIPFVVFGSLFFLVNVIFMLQVVGAGQAFLADRFTYLAYIGIFLVLAKAVEPVLAGKYKMLVIGPGVLFLVLLAFISFTRTRTWENPETLFSDVVKKYPNAVMAHNNLGFFYRDQGRNEKAIESYTQAIKYDPESFIAFSNRGEVLFELGQTDKALADMNEAIRIKPDYAKALSNRGAIYGSRKQFDLAIADLDKSLELEPGNPRALTNRLLVNYNLGRFEDALRDANLYLKINPEDPAVLNQRALCFGRLNKDQESLADFDAAIRISPNKGSYYQNRSYQQSKMGNYQAALQDIQKAKELGVKINEAYLNRLYLMMQ
jgi:tetratricopeptide (TPR) repeat protein